ncbi:MAG: hypothetical protein HPY74_15950 [Firmicutes bacterium]|nr:hypothetical protein [Bacillota bacterium]
MCDIKCDLKDKAYLKEKVRQALERLYLYDLDLIRLSSVECSISARIAMHLHTLLSCHERLEGICKYRIDCEYRKMRNDSKPAPKGYSHENMRPDILIHQRAGENGDPKEGNILFCEVKQGNKTNEDAQKIEEALSKLQYLYGLQIFNIQAGNISVQWYERTVPNYTNADEDVIVYRWNNHKLE